MKPRKNPTILLLAVLSPAALAENNWSNLARLKPGQNIQVVQTSRISLEGQFSGFSESGITLSSATGEIAIERSDVVRVSTKPPGRRQRNAVIGAAIAGAAVGTVAALVASGGSEFGPGMAVYITTAWSGIGALIGGIIPPGRTVYRVKSLPAGRRK